METIKHGHKIHDTDHKFALTEIWDTECFLNTKLNATESGKSSVI
jgi:hypothetical protein